jgi:hypothetical protein
MLFKYLFSRWNLEKQATFLKKKGILIGSRIKDNRKIYIYMHRDIFVEVTYEEDDDTRPASSLKIVKGIKKLNSYLENEFKESTF